MGKKLAFEKSITRDWGIVYAEIWHHVFTEDFKTRIGWGYTEVVFEGKDAVISVYRAPEEHIEGMRNFILQKLNGDSTWLRQHADIVMEQFAGVVSWVNAIEQRSFDTYSNQELATHFRKFVENNRELGPAFIMMLWFPIQMEGHEDADKYKAAIDTAVHAREMVEKIGPLVDEFARAIAKEVARRAHIPDNLHRYISSNEILDYLEKECAIAVPKLREREQYFIVTREGILSEPIEGYLARHGYALEKEEFNGAALIRGRTAYAGFAKGTVRIIKNKDVFDTFEDGDIIVTSMTTPDFVPIMKRAAAFVTDEGGITCHAAIVARELKKPCIIGTKIATQVLKDGDEVEVDADVGMVRIISRKAGRSSFEITAPTISDYVRLFKFDDFVPFLLGHDFVRGYFELGGMTLSYKKIWFSYMLKSALEKTQSEGLELYKDRETYEAYKRQLYQIFADIERTVNDAEKARSLTKELINEFLVFLKNYRKLYLKTEFFYTDLAFEKRKEFPTIEENFKSFEQLKLDGRDYLNRIFFLPDSLVTRLIKKVSTQFSIPFEQLLSHSLEEVVHLFDEKRVPKDVLEDRRNAYVVFAVNNDIRVIAGSKAKYFIEDALENTIYSSTLTGKVANKGIVTARAKVIKAILSDYAKLSAVIDGMEQGQVLIAETTDPAIIAACKKASAIVTNQGGMMSHAAIVSREMGIPCVVGVKDATEIIRDGDLVEVNADRGIIRIL